MARAVDAATAARQNAGMSFSEIKDQVAQLTDAERDQLAEHLRLLKVLHDPEVMAEMERRFEEMRRGVNVLTGSELKERLRQMGRAV